MLGKIGGSLAAMRRLIDVGCAESRPFRERRAEIDEIVSQIGVLSAAVSNLSRSLPGQSVINRHMEEPMRDLHEALLDMVEALTNDDDGGARRKILLDRAAASLAAYHDALRRVRADRERESIPAEESFRQGGYSLSIREAHDALARLAELLPHAEARKEESFPVVRFRKPAMPPAEWIRGGLRGALAVVAAMVFVNWQHPPGGDILIVGTYLFNAMSISAPDRKGDLGVFTLSLLAAAGWRDLRALPGARDAVDGELHLLQHHLRHDGLRDRLHQRDDARQLVRAHRFPAHRREHGRYQRAGTGVVSNHCGCGFRGCDGRAALLRLSPHALAESPAAPVAPVPRQKPRPPAIRRGFAR